MPKYFFFILTIIFFNFSYADDSLLTLKQQLDRLQREVTDLSKIVYKGSQNNKIKNDTTLLPSSDLTVFDLRVYEIEKDIKTLNENLENLVFEIDDLKKIYSQLLSKFETQYIQNIKQTESTQNSTDNEVVELKQNENNLILEENSLGTIVISSKNSLDKKEDLLIEKDNKEKLKIVKNLSPAEEFQLAYDLIRSRQYDKAMSSLKQFIDKNKEDRLAGSAHYWLGEIYLLKKEPREAALILAEGYQKYPDSIKAPEILYRLSESLTLINKSNEACNILEKFKIEYPEHKLINKILSKINELNCTILIQ